VTRFRRQFNAAAAPVVGALIVLSGILLVVLETIATPMAAWRGWLIVLGASQIVLGTRMLLALTNRFDERSSGVRHRNAVRRSTPDA
jgi:uncharacterized membrane protein SirB2